MAKRPEERYQSAAEVAAALERLLRSRSLGRGAFGGLAGEGANPSALLSQAQPSWQGRRLVLAVTVAVSLLLLSGTGLWWWGLPRSAPPLHQPPARTSVQEEVIPRPTNIPAAEKIAWLLPETVQVLGTHQGLHGCRVTCLAFHPGGKRAFSGGSDSVVRAWDLD